MKTLLLIFLVGAAQAQIMTGGSYALDQAVIASGGGRSEEPAPNGLSLMATVGQPAAGKRSSGGAYRVDSGFWTPVFAPTAASVTVTGRVLGTNGGPLRNVTVLLTGGTMTATRVAHSSSFGYFSFEDVAVGQTYVVSVLNKKYFFANAVQTVGVMDEINDIVFHATSEN